MHRRVLPAVAFMMSVCACPGVLTAQVVRSNDPNPALWQATPDAVALGGVASGFLGVERNDLVGSWLASGGLRWFGGVLHASYGQSSAPNATSRNYALGYARRLTEADGGIFGTFGTGVDFTAAYQSGATWAGDARAVRMALPLSVRWGSPSGFSFSPYIAPYAEYGHATMLDWRGCGAPSCPFASGLRAGSTLSAGLGFGGNLTLGRLGFTIGAMGVPQGLVKYVNGRWLSSAGVTLRF